MAESPQAQPVPDTLPSRCVEHVYQLQRMEGKLDKLCELLTGNGNPQRGVILRLDRLEQRAQGKVWVERTVLGAIIAAACTVIIVKGL